MICSKMAIAPYCPKKLISTYNSVNSSNFSRTLSVIRQTTKASAVDAAAQTNPTDPLESILDSILPPVQVSQDAKRAPFDNEYIIGLIWQQRRQLAAATFCLLICTASNLAAPVLTGLLMETLVQQKPVEEYGKLLLILLVGYLVEPFLTKVYMESMVSAGEKVLATLRLELFRVLLMQKVAYFDKHTASELTNLISVELDTIRTFIFNNTSRDRGPRAFLEAGGAVLVLFYLSWRLAPICSIIVVVTALAAAAYKRRTKLIEQQQGEALQMMSGVALQALENMKTVRSFAGESLERERFQLHVRSSYSAGLSFGTAKAVFEATNRGAIHASLLVLYSWGGLLVAQGLMPLGVLISGLGFTYSLTYATQGIVNTLSELRRASGALFRIRHMMSTSDVDPNMYSALAPGAWWEVANGGPVPASQPYADEAGLAAVEAARRGPLEVRTVSFSYPARSEAHVLRELTLMLPQGKVTAVVGRSGAGKSTVANLLARFYEPQSGGIYLDGQPASSFSLGEWSRAVAMVGQEPVLFSGTVGDNIAYGKWGKATQDEIEAAAIAANAHDFIMQLPKRYGTLVGERGALLSGGQRQRVALARALLKDSPILVLDEATSALDTVSEKLVQQAVGRLLQGRTVIVIAHRLSTVQSADQIVVMSKGQVAEVGTHEELSSNGAYYNELMKAQELILAST
ncbi:hypothetical protein CEUSTIGMA_g1689.t1 [Chlamydomonas eustigma]|uniref:Uncharacterized protein n=1 Tax=Chlamydomonas eustigma TaxID=1157962 RepID=A0A250WUL1_9CHLO|nr:hypothetical protein CEUSTIGMA_g1689.t1 [Chlamydomonas eustigma]|eukprot:GAX74240.1 hypothetical protein CEUSTIGMA_g1689.t1 [Chlamydomonas eustigma]